MNHYQNNIYTYPSHIQDYCRKAYKGGMNENFA
jgi:hypothetical protein